MDYYIPLHVNYDRRVSRYRKFLTETGAANIRMTPVDSAPELQVVTFSADSRCLRRLRSSIYTCFMRIIFREVTVCQNQNQ